MDFPLSLDRRNYPILPHRIWGRDIDRNGRRAVQAGIKRYKLSSCIHTYPMAVLTGRPALMFVINDIGMGMLTVGGRRTRVGLTGQVWMPRSKVVVSVREFNRVV